MTVTGPVATPLKLKLCDELKLYDVAQIVNALKIPDPFLPLPVSIIMLYQVILVLVSLAISLVYWQSKGKLVDLMKL